MRLSRYALAVAVMAAVGIPSVAQVNLEIPNGTWPATSNVFPFGSTYSPSGFTYVLNVPASYLNLANRRLNDLAFVPAGTGTWSSSNVVFAVGHLATPQPCPFTFPGAGGSTLGSFLDLTVIYNATTQGPLSFACTQDAWSPLGLAASGGTSFIWDGVHSIGILIMYQTSTLTGFTGGFRRSSGADPTRTYTTSYQPGAVATTCNSTAGAYVRLSMLPSAGLYANFAAAPVAGHAPLTVSFTDGSLTDDPAGIQSWAWDFQNDGIVDATTQNPTFTYLTPGDYTVTLTVTDATHPSSTLTRTNLISVSQYVFHAMTTGGGTGDLTLIGVPTLGAPSMTQGYTLISFTPAATVGGGPAAGLLPDAIFWSIFSSPAAPGNVLHFITSPGIYPDAVFYVPPGSLSFLQGTTADFVEVGLTAASQLVLVSNVDRVTF